MKGVMEQECDGCGESHEPAALWTSRDGLKWCAPCWNRYPGAGRDLWGEDA